MLQKNISYTITIASETHDPAKKDKGTAHPVTVKHHSPQSDLIIIQQSAKTFRKFCYMQLDTLRRIASSIMESSVVTCLKDKY
jgi:hypothetical protein